VNAAASAGLEALLERSESVSALDALLDGVRSGAGGQLAIIGGEAGVGKTTLLRMFCATRADGARALWGACEPLLTPRPLGPFFDIAEAVGGELAALLDASAKPHEVVAALLRELRARAPAILILEDLHWADDATLDVLTLLAGRIATVPALVLVTY
jgi:predicted ATPase